MNREIILMRHGQPKLAATDKLSALDMKGWIEHYNRCEITQQPVPQASLQLAATARMIVSSNAPRALTSVQALGLKPALVDAFFSEAQLPYGRWKRPRLSPFTWAFILRVLWLCGYSPSVESAATARTRASTAAQRLQALTSTGPVLLLGHGFMNRLIARQLKAQGWTRQTPNGGSHYWSATVYRYGGG
ncbi:histidine phosphatase family protein [Pseudomonas chlororaphis subsp. chlororaphis]|nr:histidine phosphatase family protein [Pseudomonas chlororaphis]ORM45652.1 histidine phosphatase family protein [Pseudomonas chlororaphis subsp. chlororaphis]TWR91929.1 histidine phosphatase family protein [Pseudomonas chlororaphis subsp. chlororaphis]SMQ09310.1 Broad specificity phosphatase PhoE [Pseudomonas chlororaphis]